ncbi:MAG: inorganic diphosphatase, partial [Thermodesulfobacteriota bacterium]
SYKTLEKKNVHVEGWRNKDAALQTIKEAQERYKNKGKKKKKKANRASDWL